jgi:hypothetical protein
VVPVPARRAKQISLLFDTLISDKESDVEMEAPSPYKGYETRIYRSLKWYMVVRRRVCR